MKDGSFLVIVFNSNNWDNQLFKSLEDDNRQIYIIDKEKHLLASHNFTPDVFKETVDSLPPYFEVEEPIVLVMRKTNRLFIYIEKIRI